MEKLIVEQDKCIGCGMCVNTYPDYFDFNDEGLSKVIKENINEEEKKELLNAVEMCPTEAIVIEN